jgi:hypothetical protein
MKAKVILPTARQLLPTRIGWKYIVFSAFMLSVLLLILDAEEVKYHSGLILELVQFHFVYTLLFSLVTSLIYLLIKFCEHTYIKWN